MEPVETRACLRPLSSGLTPVATVSESARWTVGFETGVVLATENGAVPVETLEIICALKVCAADQVWACSSDGIGSKAVDAGAGRG